MLAFWQPIPLTLWHATGPLAVPLWALFAIGWTILLSAGITFNLFELLGMRQAWAWYRRRTVPPLTLKTHWLYDWMRHPMYVGVLLGLWMTPHMTAGHALMAATFTLYILIAMRYEERDLSASFGGAYRAWRAGDDRGRLLPGRDGRAAR
jgi:protein-S-isoprenylcysteine O-methyltransferase Ste14